LALGLFAKLAILHALITALPLIDGIPYEAVLLGVAPAVQLSAAVAGLLGVLCSVMVYVATKRAQWSGARTGVKFIGTTALLGAAAVFFVSQLGGPSWDRGTTALLWLVVAASLAKLTFEGAGLLHARERQNTVFKRMAKVMLGDLQRVTLLRFSIGLVGGVLVPLALLKAPIEANLVPVVSLAMLVSVLLGEASERYLFFRAAPASRMPGNLK